MARGILITGASSGLGEGLALAYAAAGATLFLSGRDAPRTEAVAAACRARGAEAEGRIVDVADQAAMAEWIAVCEARAPLALVIANAGVSLAKREGVTEATMRRTLAVNLEGVLNTVMPALGGMEARGNGQIALVASLAGFRGAPRDPTYCASKAAVRLWGEGMRPRLARQGIGLTVICPGFVRSRMTADNPFPMPFLMETEAAVRAMKRGIDANRARVSFPWPLAALVWLLAAVPPAWTDPLVARAAGG